MEILILQYTLLVLICLWWIKPFKQIILAKHFKLSFFNLLCILALLFIGSYTFVHEIALKAGIHEFYTILYLVINSILFCMIPAGYLYLRNQIIPCHFTKKDLLHLISPCFYITCFVLPYFISPARILNASIESGFLFKAFGYCTLGIYSLLVIKFLLNKYLILAPLMKKKKMVTSPSIANPNDGKEIGLNEIVVGSVRFNTGQLAEMDANIKNFITAKQPFLKRGYNLRQLAEDTSIPLHHLSAFINQHYHIHFNDFINKYRVYYCQMKIKNDEWRAKTLEAIAEESGFNNRNTFTTAFKKVTGYNPSDFLKMVKQQQIA